MLYGSQKEYYDAMVASAGLRGAVYWVDSVNGNDDNDGLSSDRPKLTITDAITDSNTNIALTANTNKNNTIFIRGGTYTANITTPALQTDLIGLDNRTGWSPRIAGYIAVNDAKGMRLFNLQITNATAVPTVRIYGASHNFEMHNCEIRWATGTTYGFHLNGDSYYVKIRGCRFTADHAYGIYVDGKCKGLQILDNWINASTCGIYIKSGDSTTTSFDGLIKGNVITRSDPNSTAALATGIDFAAVDMIPHIMIVGNWISATNAINIGLDDNVYYWTEMRCIDNHTVSAAAGVGVIETAES